MITSDLEWAEVQNRLGISQFYLNDIQTCAPIFDGLASRFAGSVDLERKVWHAKALVNKRITLGTLGLGKDELAV